MVFCPEHCWLTGPPEVIALRLGTRHVSATTVAALDTDRGLCQIPHRRTIDVIDRQARSSPRRAVVALSVFGALTIREPSASKKAP